MIVAGIDVGSKTVKAVVLDDGRVAGRALALAGMDARAAAGQAFRDACAAAGVEPDSVTEVISTGAGRKEVENATGSVTEVGADALGAVHLAGAVRTVIDVGAEEGRGIRCDASGKVVDFAINEKCAAGAGVFTEAMARALEVRVEELGALSRRSTRAVPMNAQCAVFAESEVVSLLHAKTPKEDIARAVHDAIASRIVSMARKVGFEEEICLIGGLAHNQGFVDSLNRALESTVRIPEEPEYVGALGAALRAGR